MSEDEKEKFNSLLVDYFSLDLKDYTDNENWRQKIINYAKGVKKLLPRIYQQDYESFKEFINSPSSVLDKFKNWIQELLDKGDVESFIFDYEVEHLVSKFLIEEKKK